jgi:hypothetical protein
MSAPTKVLFLDIDGVLNSYRSCYAFNGFPHSFTGKCRDKFDWTAVALVRNLCEETGASIVLSSSWRIGRVVHECANGLDLPIFDFTPRIAGYDGKVRGDEIDAWLKAHPEVTQYAIVDDDSDMLLGQLPRFVKTTHEDGLSFANFLALKELLA